ncbi:MAG: ribonuclease III [Candidatus Zixiibacteriota bacterium]
MTLLDSLKKLFSSGGSRGELEKLTQRFSSVFRYDFTDESLLLEALVHRSYIRTDEGAGRSSYERLEFLGDSVLGLIVSEELYRTYTEYSEGELTKLKSLLVNEVSLARIGREAGLGKFVLLSSEEERSGGRERQSILADCFEAVLGAIYLDSSLETARSLVKRLILSRADEILADKSQVNYKGRLLELLQSEGVGSPAYEVVDEEGPDHRKIFQVVIKFKGERLGMGQGMTKKVAEQMAAMQALERLEARSGGRDDHSPSRSHSRSVFARGPRLW